MLEMLSCSRFSDWNALADAGLVWALRVGMLSQTLRWAVEFASACSCRC